MTFESTLPLGEPELMRVSAFQRYLEELRRESGDESLTRLSSLNPSLLQDLLRFEQDGRRTELLEVIGHQVFAEIEIPIARGDWRDQLRDVHRAMLAGVLRPSGKRKSQERYRH